MRNWIIFGVFCISIIAIIELSTMNTLYNRLDRIVTQDSEKSNVDSTQIKQKEEKDISEESNIIADFVIECVIPVYIDFINTNINQKEIKHLYLNGENNDFQMVIKTLYSSNPIVYILLYRFRSGY